MPSSGTSPNSARADHDHGPLPNPEKKITRRLTNNSGLNIDWGDVVIQDATMDDAFTANTTLAYSSGWIGVAQQPIGSNSRGSVLLSGYTPVINVGSNSTTRGMFLYGSNTARRAYGASGRSSGAFGQALSTGVAPDALIWPTSDGPAASSVAAVTKSLTNKSGGTVNEGDAVIVDETTNESFTTTASKDIETSIGIVKDASIAADAVGSVTLVGYTALSNTASIAWSRGDYIYTSSNAKITHGSNTRNPGAFGQYLQAGSNSSAWLWGAGDQTATGGAGGGSDLAGKEVDYVEKTSSTTITATSEATAQTIITGTSVAYDGSTVVFVEVYLPQLAMASSANTICVLDIYEDSTILGRIATAASSVTPTDFRVPVSAHRRRTPSSASHQFILKAWKSGTATTTLDCGAGGTATLVPGFLRVTRVA